MKPIHKFVFAMALIMAISILFVQLLRAEKIGEFYISGWISQTSALVEAFDDPDVSGVTCFVSRTSTSLSMSDASNSSIACRQTGVIALGWKVNANPEGVEVFSQNLSLFTKVLRMRRIYDQKRKVLIYVTYSPGHRH